MEEYIEDIIDASIRVLGKKPSRTNERNEAKLAKILDLDNLEDKVEAFIKNRELLARHIEAVYRVDRTWN